MVRSFLAKFSPKSEGCLLALCLNNPNNDSDINEWNKKAVRHLVKELRKDLKLIEELEKAISQQCSRSKCVLVPKTLDRRLLVSHRRGLPQVIYCRLWRWPDLQSHHQIKAICSYESCDDSQQGAAGNSESCKICINPYHYERIFPRPIEPILVPSQRIPPDLSTSFEDSDTTGETRARPGTIRGTVTFARQVELGAERDRSWPSMVNDFVPPDPPSPQFPQGSPQVEPQQYYQPHQPAQLPQQPQQIQQPHQPQQLQHIQQAQQQQRQQQQQAQQHQQQVLQHQQQIQQHHQHQHLNQRNHPQQQYHHYQDAAPHQQYVHSQDPYCYQPQQADAYAAAQGTQYQQSAQAFASTSHYHHYQAVPPSQGAQGTSGAQQEPIAGPSDAPRPYRFKHPRFGSLARSRSSISQYSQQQDSYMAPQYTYGTQQSHVSYQPYHQTAPVEGTPMVLQQQPHLQQQPCSTTNYPVLDGPPVHYAQPGPTYTTMYPPGQQPQYSEQQQDQPMQVSYQTTAATPQAAETLYNPVVVPSAAEDQPMDEAPVIDIAEVPYEEGQYWCSISYHEYDQRIGEKYQSNCKILCVDGYTQPMCTDRFCIGGISNINRNQFTEWVRRRIGRGVRFSYVNGEVYAEALSEASVFVSNPLATKNADEKSVDEVSKLTQGHSARVFSTAEFADLLKVAVNKGFESVYKLTNCCVIRVSFVKGWGKNYKRQSIFNTPCWAEVQLNGPLQWIDKVLRQLRPPGGCGSTS